MIFSYIVVTLSLIAIVAVFFVGYLLGCEKGIAEGREYLANFVLSLKRDYMNLDEMDKKRVENLFGVPFYVGILTGVGCSLMAIAISSTYCTYSKEEVFYLGLMSLIICFGIVAYSQIKEDA